MEINEDDVIRMLLGLPKGKQVEHPLWTEAEASQPEVFIYHLSPGKKHGRGLLDSAAGSMPAMLACCTFLAAALWVALLIQTRRLAGARARAAHAAAAAAAASIAGPPPILVIQPDDSVGLGAKLYRTDSGNMRPLLCMYVAAKASSKGGGCGPLEPSP